MTYRIVAVIVVATSLLASGCSTGRTVEEHASSAPAAVASATSTPEPASGEPADLAGLRAALAGAGLDVGAYRSSKLGARTLSLLPKARRYQILRIDQGALNVFRFASLHDASKAASMVDSHGGLPLVEFKGRPHFFRQGSVIVFYVEEQSSLDSTVIGILRSRLGSELGAAR